MRKDIVNECVAKMVEADGILLGSPTYFADVSAGMKALIERCGMVSRANGDLYKRKVGAGVVAVRRAGAYHVLSSLNAFFLIGQMIVPGSSYWNIAVGREPGEVANDAEGMKTMRDLGQNMAWLLKKLHASAARDHPRQPGPACSIATSSSRCPGAERSLKRRCRQLPEAATEAGSCPPQGAARRATPQMGRFQRPSRFFGPAAGRE